MNNQFDKLTKGMAQSVSRGQAPKKFGVGFASMALTVALVLPAWSAENTAGTSTVVDPAGDAVFPYDLFNAPAPYYLDVVKASVSLKRDVFHFEIQVNGEIPDNADPGFIPSVNHLGPTFGIRTDPKTAGEPFKFFGQSDTYRFNFLVGALYSSADSGVGLERGWRGFLIDVDTFTVVEIPLQVRRDTLIFETNSSSLGDPKSFDWAVGSECDPVPIPDEKTKSVLLVDYAPDHGYATWPSQ